MTYPGPTTLAAGRLLLRPPEERDVPAIVEACQDEAIARWIPVPVPYTEDHARQFVAERPDRWQDAEHGEMTFAITDAADGRLLGMVGLHARDATMREIGYWTAPWARGQGVMTAAARMVCEFGFEVLGLERIEWWAGGGQRRLLAGRREAGLHPGGDLPEPAAAPRRAAGRLGRRAARRGAQREPGPTAGARGRRRAACC